jgi:flagellar basal-body rod protein FlgB
MAVAITFGKPTYANEDAMPIDLDSALGGLPKALQVYARRTEVLASNLANSDTPNYKARDIDFRAALGTAQGQMLAMKTTHGSHLNRAGDNGLGAAGESLYRVPSQPSLDGNTVDTQVEHAQFTQNAVQYQTTLQFLSGRIKGLMGAIRGD